MIGIIDRGTIAPTVVVLGATGRAGHGVVEALVDAVSQDQRVSVAEGELLRTVCAVLHCPLPAMLERA